MKVEGTVGPRTLADGTDAAPRLTKDGSQAIAAAHGRWHEIALRGKLFMLDSDSVTMAAANATKGAGGTIKLVNGVYNPPTSGVNLSILLAQVATVSGTPAGPFYYNFLEAVSTLAATGTIRSGMLGQVGSAVTPQVNTAVTLSGGATTAFKQLGVLGGPAAIASGAGMYDVRDEVEGRIIVPPGVIFGIAGVGAGTSHVVQSTLVWEEVAV